ncbi:MAG: 3-oxoacyl-ACP reductase FabG [Pseudomonadota bacterium]|nr:3-oxoacyl-ACP reductase FabG [Pseudomonadota bacterium]
MARVIAITGAGRGIGLATAKAFAAMGEILALNYRSTREPLEAVVAETRARGGDGLMVEADIAKPREAGGFIAAAEQEFGRIDVLINNAGILFSTPTHTATIEQWDQTIAVNLTGTYCCIRAALPGMLAKKAGRIINVSSELGLIGFPTYAAYSASKGGIIALTKAIAKEVAPHGILVNSIAPGPVETDMLIHDTIEYNEATRQQMPLGRFGRPEEIAAMIVAMAGEAGSFLVGQVISPNGGTAI